MLNKISWHMRHLLYQAGMPVRFGSTRFKMPGYFSGHFASPDSRHERFMGILGTRLLQEHPGAFIDVGVNIGQTFARVLAADPKRRYIGFEPQLSCCFNVDQFIRANGICDAHVVPIALSDSNGLRPFFSNDEADECASLVSDGTKQQEVSFVQCRLGDEVMDEMQVDSIAAVKIDVEGAEVHVIRGLRHTLQKLRPPVFFEVLPNFFGVTRRRRHKEDVCERNRSAADALASEFDQLNYAIFQIDEDTAEEMPIRKFELDDEAGFRGTSFLARPR